MRTVVLPAPGHEALASKLARHLAAEPGVVESRRFPDGETYVRVATDVKDATVVIAASLRDPDPQMPTLLFMADAARELGAKRVGLAAPYLAYMRQDRRFLAGEAVTSRSFAAVLSRTFDWIATVDPHLHRLSSLDAIYSIPAAVVHAAPRLSAWIHRHVPDAIVIGPDSESRQWAEEVATAAGVEVAVLEKRRHGDRDVDITAPDMELGDRTPVLIDDIISSAKTMSQAARLLNARARKRAVCIGIHAVFAPGAEEALRAAGIERVVTCDTIAHATNAIEVLDLLAEAIPPLSHPGAP